MTTITQSPFWARVNRANKQKDYYLLQKGGATPFQLSVCQIHLLVNNYENLVINPFFGSLFGHDARNRSQIYIPEE